MSKTNACLVAVAMMVGLGPVGRVDAAGAPSLDGPWTGALAVHTSQGPHPAIASLVTTDGRVTGTVTLVVNGVTSTFAVTGTAHGNRARITGTLAPRRLRWKAHWSRARAAWRGVLVVRGGGRLRGMLTVRRDGDDPATACGLDVFTATVMPSVLEPVCSQCHVDGGAAQHTRFRVSRGDAATTARSAFGLVDAAAPERSLLLQKPLAAVSHGGGPQIAPGSEAERILLDWIALVTAPGCDGGGGGGGGGATGDPYLDHCASCHGEDARGVDGLPDIHCNRDVRPIVRAGRTGLLGVMPAFPELTDAEITTIQARLVASCPITSVTGAEVYAGNCASCHGSDATGGTAAPGIRCATRVANAVRVGRGAAMPAMPDLATLEVGRLAEYLGTQCTAAGRPGAELWEGNCAGCHGAAAQGGRNGLGVEGPDVQCTGGNDYAEKVREGDDEMPPFPGLGAGDVDAIVAFVHGEYCTGD